jgi:hypothetical protein
MPALNSVITSDRLLKKRLISAFAKQITVGAGSRSWPRITPSILLKSWATPPAYRPTDSIFRASAS